MFKILPTHNSIEVNLPQCPESPTEFWVTSDGDQGKINQLRSDLNNHFKTRSNEDGNGKRRLKVGKVFALKDEHDVWRRVMVESLDDTELRDVDTGKLLPLSSIGLLHDLPTEFQTEFMGVCCRLSGIICKGHRLTWSQRSLEVFRTNFKPMKMRVLGFESTNIHIVEVTVEGNRDLATVLVQAGVAEHLDLEDGLKSLKSILSIKTCRSRFEVVQELQLPKLPLSSGTKELDASSEHLIGINHVVTPNQFYANLLSSLVKLEQLQSEMDAHYKSHEEGEYVANIFFNSYAVKCDPLGSWKRGSILNLRDGKVLVFLCDYGYTKTVSLRCLVPLDEKFSALPAQAICCSLGLEEMQWQKQEVEYFTHLTSKSIFSIKITEKKKYKVIVEFSSNSDIKQSMENFIKDSRSDFEKAAKDELDDAPITKEVVGPEREESRKATNYPVNDVKMEVGDDVVVTAVEATRDFYIMKMKGEDQQKFQQLMINLRSHCSTSDSISSISQSQPVACKINNLWARASVLKFDANSVEVIFVDFGKKALVKIKEIKDIPDSLINFLPAQSFHCSLDLPGYVFNDTIEGRFKSNCEGSLCNIGFAKKEGDKYVVDVIMGGESVCERLLLLNDSQASWCDQMELEEEKMFKDVQGLTEGCEVIVVDITSPDDFYVQRKSDAMTEILKTIINALNNSRLIPCRVVNEGMFVAAQFEGLWYRAIVTEIKDDGLARVFFVDFGNESVIDKQLLCTLTNSICITCPHLAQQCRLNGSAKRFDPCITEVFKESCLEKTFLVKNVRQDALGLYLLDLIDPKASKLVFDLHKSMSTKWTVPNSSDGDKLKEESDGVKVASAESCLSIGDLVSIKYSRHPCDFFISKDDDELNALTLKLMESCHEAVQAVKEGDVVAISWEDFLSRAKILELLPDNKMKVLFVDFGNSEVVDRSKAKELPRELKDSNPKPVVHCWLAKMASEEWNEESAHWFKESFEWRPFELSSMRNSGVVDEYGGMICEVELIREDGGFLGEMVRERMTPNRSSTVRLADLGRFELKDECKCAFLHSMSPNKFFCQSVDAIIELSGLFPPPSCAEYKPISREICLAFDEDYHDWYRSEVIEVGTTSVLVRAIDLEEDLEVSFTHLRVLPAFMKKFPPLAFPCSLQGTSPIGLEWTKKSNDHFSSLLANQVIKIKFIKRDGDVHVVDVTNAKGESISDKMKELKFAK